MNKRTTYHFEEALTKRAAREFISARDTNSLEPGAIPQDYLWDIMQRYRWPVEQMVYTPDGLRKFQSLGSTVLTRITIHDTARSILENLDLTD
jgi:hypothetical protein